MDIAIGIESAIPIKKTINTDNDANINYRLLP